MTPETRRRVLRYGIAVDLVIVATGIGMLLPPMPNALTVAYVAAVGLATWKGGWKGGATALVLSALAIAYLFVGSTMTSSHLVAFVAAAAVTMAIVVAAQQRRVSRDALRLDAPIPERAANVVSFERDDFERESRERQKLARSVERAAAEQLSSLRPPAPAEELLPVQPPPPSEPAAPASPSAPAGKTARSSKKAEKKNREAERRAAEHAARSSAETARKAALAAEEESRRAAEEALQRRIEEERRAAEEAAQRLIDEERRAAEQAALAKAEEERRAVEEAAQRRIEEERRAAEEAALAKAEEERRAVEEAAQRRIEEERRAAEEAAERLIAEERRAAEQAALARAEEERRAAEESVQRRIEEERRAADEAAQRLIEEERRTAEQLALARVEDERRAAEQAVERRIEEERRATEAELQKRLEAERQAMRQEMEAQLASERAALKKQADEQLSAFRKSGPQPRAKPKTAVVAQAASAVAETAAQVAATLGGLFRRKQPSRSINVGAKRIAVKTPAPPRRPVAPVAKRTTGAAARRPKLLLLERRRGTADTIIPRLRQRGVEAEVVERWVDAVDELFRFRPDALLLDLELADFDKIYRTITEQNASLPIILTGRDETPPPSHVRYAAHLSRPYDVEELSRVAGEAMSQPEKLLLKQNTRRSGPVKTDIAVKARAPRPAAHAATAIALPAPAPQPVAPRSPGSDEYDVNCFNCRIAFDALEADWCSCLTKERTLVCTNCLTCFCKAPPSYKEKFWVEAPARVFERKAGEARHQQSRLGTNPPLHAVKRPLVLTVEDDEEIQAIVQRVCTNLGYGFIYATNGQDGLAVAREYRPNLILSDAFMPKLDGREMCRLLKEEPLGDECRMIVMTGLYTDTKYRSEALKRFKVDDYVAKPVAINELISLLQKHLEGVSDMSVEDVDLHELHRRDVEDAEADDVENGIPLGDLLDAASMDDDESSVELELPQPRAARPAPERDEYSVCCFNCSGMFDAVHAEWCSCVGRDQTLVCTNCHGCFCKAPAAYKERFWMDAPPSLFERKMIGSKRSLGSRNNPDPFEVKRPLILLVEDDENVQLIVRTVVTSMGFGFIVGANGQEGLSLAREYNPDLILSDAFMPKLDGREMCRLLKEDPITARAKAIIMTGLYTDRKYRNEALDYFKVDDYVAKPLAVDDLIKLFKKHLPQEVQATM